MTTVETDDPGKGQVVAQAASVAAEQGKHVAETAAEGAKDVAHTAKDQASQVASEVASQGKNLLHETKGQLTDQARVQTDQIAQAMRRLGDQAQALADGRAQEAGPVGEYTRHAAAKLSDLASHVEQRGFEGILRDLQVFARRRPGTFLFGAAVAGFAMGRLIRGVSAAGAAQPRPTGHQNTLPIPPAMPALEPTMSDIDVPEQSSPSSTSSPPSMAYSQGDGGQ